MRAKLNAKWRELKALPVGRRFQIVHQRQAGASAWVKALVIGGAVLSFAVGVVLMVVPGPAFVFFGLTAALAAVASSWVARKLDRAEVATRKWIAQMRRRRRASRP